MMWKRDIIPAAKLYRSLRMMWKRDVIPAAKLYRS